MPSAETMRPPWRLLLAAACLALVACPGQQQQRNQAARDARRPRPTPAPAFRSFAGATRAELITYAHSLQFDTTRPASDANFLVVPRTGQLAVGPYAALTPEIGAGTITERDLSAGRFLARFALEQPCPEAGLPGGVSYLWVDSTGGALRAVLVPELASLDVQPLTLTTREVCEPGRNWTLATAWLEERPAAADSLAMRFCWTCDCTTCCSDTRLRDVAAPASVRRAPASGVRR